MQNLADPADDIPGAQAMHATVASCPAAFIKNVPAAQAVQVLESAPGVERNFPNAQEAQGCPAVVVG